MLEISPVELLDDSARTLPEESDGVGERMLLLLLEDVIVDTVLDVDA